MAGHPHRLPSFAILSWRQRSNGDCWAQGSTEHPLMGLGSPVHDKAGPARVSCAIFKCHVSTGPAPPHPPAPDPRGPCLVLHLNPGASPVLTPCADAEWTPVHLSTARLMPHHHAPPPTARPRVCGLSCLVGSTPPEITKKWTHGGSLRLA